MALSSATLTYKVNATGVVPAATLVTQFEALSIVSASFLAIYGAALTSQLGTSIGNVATLVVLLDISSTTFQKRFPAEEVGGTNLFRDQFTAVLRAALLHPVLAATPVFA